MTAGLRNGKGFCDYSNRYIAAYREERLDAFIELLSLRGLLSDFGHTKSNNSKS